MKRREFLKNLFVAGAGVSVALSVSPGAIVGSSETYTRTFSEMVALTFQSHRQAFIDNIEMNNKLLARLRDRGIVKPFSGGITFG